MKSTLSNKNPQTDNEMKSMYSYTIRLRVTVRENVS